jgi:hypothetical protein
MAEGAAGTVGEAGSLGTCDRAVGVVSPIVRDDFGVRRGWVWLR